MSAARYPELAKLMGAWFHQDYDLDGEGVADVVKAYVRVTPSLQRAKLVEDIARFRLENAGELDEIFLKTFEPDVMPEAISGSTSAFLQEITETLRQ